MVLGVQEHQRLPSVQVLPALPWFQADRQHPESKRQKQLLIYIKGKKVKGLCLNNQILSKVFHNYLKELFKGSFYTWSSVYLLTLHVTCNLCGSIIIY